MCRHLAGSSLSDNPHGRPFAAQRGRFNHSCLGDRSAFFRLCSSVFLNSLSAWEMPGSLVFSVSTCLLASAGSLRTVTFNRRINSDLLLSRLLLRKRFPRRGMSLRIGTPLLLSFRLSLT